MAEKTCGAEQLTMEVERERDKESITGGERQRKGDTVLLVGFLLFFLLLRVPSRWDSVMEI